MALADSLPTAWITTSIFQSQLNCLVLHPVELPNFNSKSLNKMCSIPYSMICVIRPSIALFQPVYEFLVPQQILGGSSREIHFGCAIKSESTLQGYCNVASNIILFSNRKKLV